MDKSIYSKRVKLLFKFLQIFSIVIIVYCISMLLTEFFSIYVANNISEILDGILQHKSFNEKSDIISIFICMGIIVVVCPCIKYFSYKLYTFKGADMEKEIYSDFLDQSKEYVDTFDKGTLIYRLCSDAILYRSKMFTIFGDGIVAIITICFSVYIMVQINVEITLVCLLVNIVPFIVVKILKRKITTIYNEEQERNEEILEVERQIVKNFVFIKVNDIGYYMKDRLKDKFQCLSYILMRKNKWQIFLDNFQSYFEIMSTMVIYILSSIFISKKLITPGKIVLFLSILKILQHQISAILVVVRYLLTVGESSKRLCHILFQQEKVQGKINVDSIYDIRMKNLGVTLNHKNILKNININIKEKDKIIIKGNNGSGKSTLAKVLTGMCSYHGEYAVNDIDVNHINLESLRKNIFTVSQNPFLLNESVYENIRILAPKVSEDYIEKVMKNLGILDLKYKMAGDNGCNLSGGERQKVAIAQAMISSKKIFILDEIENNLDEGICGYVMEYFANKPCTLFIITHNDVWSHIIKKSNTPCNLKEILI